MADSNEKLAEIVDVIKVVKIRPEYKYQEKAKAIVKQIKHGKYKQTEEYMKNLKSSTFQEK